MAFNEKLAERVRKLLDGTHPVEEKRMFGGLAFMVNGRMACGIDKERLMVRTLNGRHEELLKKPHAGVMDITGRPMRGFLFVQPKGYANDADLAFWLEEAKLFAFSAPEKPAKKQKQTPGKPARRRT